MGVVCVFVFVCLRACVRARAHEIYHHVFLVPAVVAGGGGDAQQGVIPRPPVAPALPVIKYKIRFIL